jgi:hypothetical protein
MKGLMVWYGMLCELQHHPVPIRKPRVGVIPERPFIHRDTKYVVGVPCTFPSMLSEWYYFNDRPFVGRFLVTLSQSIECLARSDS